MANIKIISIEPASSFKGKDGQDVSAQRMVVEIDGPIRVAAYGDQVAVIEAMGLKAGTVTMGMFRKAPSITLG
jgi:hypothetical protein